MATTLHPLCLADRSDKKVLLWRTWQRSLSLPQHSMTLYLFFCSCCISGPIGSEGLLITLARQHSNGTLSCVISAGRFKPNVLGAFQSYTYTSCWHSLWHLVPAIVASPFVVKSYFATHFKQLVLTKQYGLWIMELAIQLQVYRIILRYTLGI